METGKYLFCIIKSIILLDNRIASTWNSSYSETRIWNNISIPASFVIKRHLKFVLNECLVGLFTCLYLFQKKLLNIIVWNIKIIEEVRRTQRYHLFHIFHLYLIRIVITEFNCYSSHIKTTKLEWRSWNGSIDYSCR